MQNPGLLKRRGSICRIQALLGAKADFGSTEDFRVSSVDSGSCSRAVHTASTQSGYLSVLESMTSSKLTSACAISGVMCFMTSSSCWPDGHFKGSPAGTSRQSGQSLSFRKSAAATRNDQPTGFEFIDGQISKLKIVREESLAILIEGGIEIFAQLLP